MSIYVEHTMFQNKEQPNLFFKYHTIKFHILGQSDKRWALFFQLFGEPEVCHKGSIRNYYPNRNEGVIKNLLWGEYCTYCLFFALASRPVSGCEKEAVPSIYAAQNTGPINSTLTLNARLFEFLHTGPFFVAPPVLYLYNF